MKTHDQYFRQVCQIALRQSKDANKDLARHKNSKAHQRMLGNAAGRKQYSCPVHWCGKKMPRNDNMNRHIKSQHPEQPLL
jgi:uncharacterized Zn-finger protein